MKPQALLLAFLLLALPAASQTAVSVRYRSAETIYLDAGRAAGIDVGDRLEILRGGQTIAEIEVIFVAERSASAKILSERQTIQPGDRTRMLGGGTSEAPPPTSEQPAAPEPQATEPAPAPEPEPSPFSLGGGSRSRLSRTRIAGAITVDWESFTDRSPDEADARSYDRSVARLNLRVRDIAGSPLQLRLRARSLDVSRERAGIATLPETESRDRLYEAALIWDEPDARFAVRAGRLGTSPFVGLGYVDGVLGEVRILPALAVGAVYGRRPEMEELGFASSGSKAGAFLRLARPANPEGREAELLLAGIREEGEGDLAGDQALSREYVTLETRFDSGERWSFFQRAEVDLAARQLNRGPADEVQLSNASLAAMGRISDRSRLVISWDYLQRYLTEADLSVSDLLFDRFWRQGLRVSWQQDRESGLNLSLTGGFRSREEALVDPRSGLFDSRETWSLGLGLHHPKVPGLGISAGLNAMGYGNGVTDGVLVNARAGRRLGSAGHELDFTLGGNVYRTAFEQEHALAWGRATLWLELPLDLFGQAEVELLAGDEELAGQRLRFGLGYRF